MLALARLHFPLKRHLVSDYRTSEDFHTAICIAFSAKESIFYFDDQEKVCSEYARLRATRQNFPLNT